MVTADELAIVTVVGMLNGLVLPVLELVLPLFAPLSTWCADDSQHNFYQPS